MSSQTRQGTKRGLFLGYGYSFGADIEAKDCIFIGISFMGLKDRFDPQGKILGGP